MMAGGLDKENRDYVRERIAAKANLLANPGKAPNPEKAPDIVRREWDTVPSVPCREIGTCAYCGERDASSKVMEDGGWRFICGPCAK